jgi:hypothetical protein
MALDGSELPANVELRSADVPRRSQVVAIDARNEPLAADHGGVDRSVASTRTFKSDVELDGAHLERSMEKRSPANR